VAEDASDPAARELDRQVENLLAKGYPGLAGLSEDEFVEQLAPLRRCLPEVGAENGSQIPFLLAVKSDVVPAERAVPLVELGGKRGVVGMDPTEPSEFAAIDGLDVPSAPVYLVVDVDPGGATLNVTPDRALEQIVGAGRSPLTIDEGVALVTHYPDALTRWNAFSILGSRRGDRRVPALWVSAGRPRLGWCWAGNPHTWLGSASCASRVGP
jgi:Family of unknown function (DUF5701)